MDRRAFLKLSGISGLVLSLPDIAARAAQAAAGKQITAGLKLEAGQITGPLGRPAVNFGPDLPVNNLYQKDGVWFAQVGPAERQFWLKSYNGRAWGSLNWTPRPNSSALKP